MRPPFVIIEGPDCTGKTTLSNYLARFFGSVFLFHATAQGKLPVAMADYQSNILDNCEVAQELGQAVVLDRHWPSEHVYGPIFRPGNPHGFDGGKYERRISGMGGIYIFCDRNDVVEAHQKEQDPDHPYDVASFRRVVDGYRKLRAALDMNLTPLIEYDVNVWGTQMHEFARLIHAKNHELQSRVSK